MTLRRIFKHTFVLLLSQFLAFAAFHPANAGFVDFDYISAPNYFSDVMPWTGLGPSLSFPGVSLGGGVILNGSFWGVATSPPNVYETSSFLPLYDGSLLPGNIGGVFSHNVDYVSVDIFNGNSSYAGVFTLTAYSDHNTVLGSQVIFLTPYGTPGSIGFVGFTAPGIRAFTLTTSLDVCNDVFGIDNVEFGVCVPESSTAVLMLLGMIGICLYGASRRRVAMGRCAEALVVNRK